MSPKHERFRELLDPMAPLLGIIRDADQKPFTAALLTVVKRCRQALRGSREPGTEITVATNATVKNYVVRTTSCSQYKFERANS